MSTYVETAKQIQKLLFTTQDGQLGPISLSQFEGLAAGVAIRPNDEWTDITPPVAQSPVTTTASPAAPVAPQGGAITKGWGTIFADASDLKAFQACKAEGKSDVTCFEVGDNCIGCWGDATGPGTGLACALPPDDWHKFGAAARHKPVKITLASNGNSVVALLKDTLPAKANIHNGSVCDMNQDTCEALGLSGSDIKVQIEWEWA